MADSTVFTISYQGEDPVKNILFITSNSLATNPRLVKEIRTSLMLGHAATVVSFSFQNWSKSLNDRLLEEFDGRLKLITLPGGREDRVAWFSSTCISKFAHLLLPFAQKSPAVLSFALFKRSFSLCTAVRKLPENFDLVIAHNPGAFFPALHVANRHKVPLGIDIEDFHPGESENPLEIKRMKQLMSSVLAQAYVITAASPEILRHSSQLMRHLEAKKAVINNVFTRRLQPAFQNLAGVPMKIVWFSQTVGLNRGIQECIRAMNAIRSFQIQLTIIGDCSPHVRHNLTALLTTTTHTLVFLPPMQEEELVEVCSGHQMGIALEIDSPPNRDICLTNKLFVYLLAGCAIIATETTAQKDFLTQYPGIGKTFPLGDTMALTRILETFYCRQDVLLNTRTEAYRLAKEKLNWEEESKKFAHLYCLNEAGSLPVCN